MAIAVKTIDMPDGKKAAELDENGRVIFIDDELGDDDPKKIIPVDVVSTYQTVPSLRAEAASHRKNADELKKKLEVFGDIDADKAREAITLVQNLKDGDLVKAGEVEALKKQYADSFADEKRSLIDGFTHKETGLKKDLETKDAVIRDLMISSQFSKSSFFSGENPKTIIPPEIAETYFGGNFKIESVNGKETAVAYLNGEKLYSRTNPGNLATFDEAIERIIDASPNKNRIIASTKGGSGGGGGNSNFTTVNEGGVIRVTRGQMKDRSFYESKVKPVLDAGGSVSYID